VAGIFKGDAPIKRANIQEWEIQKWARKEEEGTRSLGWGRENLVETLAIGGCGLRRFRARGHERFDGSGTTFERFCGPRPPGFLLAGVRRLKKAVRRPVMDYGEEYRNTGCWSKDLDLKIL
jgi:hypothetical protein